MNDAEAADKLRGLADRVPWQDLTQGMTTRDYMHRYGMSRGAAWRARTGRTKNPAFTHTPDFHNRRAGEAFRRWASRTIRVGKVPVYYIGRGGRPRPEGYRYIPAIDLEDPEAIVNAIEDGEYLEAIIELGNQIMNEYGAGPGAGDPYINIAEWPDDLFD